MAKKRIHLTEGQLYGLVEQAINELDWRTYASAMNKSIPRWREKGMDATHKRAAAFKNAAEKAFKQENGADIDIFPSVYAPSFRYKGVNNDLNFKFSRHKEPEGQWSGYPKDAEDEYGNTVEDPNIVKDWENMDKIAAFGNGWDVYNKKSGRWETRPTEMEWDDETGQYNWKPTDESFARKVTESVMRKLRESEDVDDVQKYEDALLGASLFRETAKYPYYYELRRIGEVGIGFNGNVNISNRYGDRVVLTPQAADELIKRGIVQTGDLYGTVMLFRNPQERGEALRQMVNILKTHHPNLR